MVRGVPPGDEHGDQPNLDRLEDGDGLAVGHNILIIIRYYIILLLLPVGHPLHRHPVN